MESSRVAPLVGGGTSIFSGIAKPQDPNRRRRRRRRLTRRKQGVTVRFLKP
jgi:hypothetical protein